MPRPTSPSGSACRPSGRPTTSWFPEDAAADYGRIYEAILTLAWVGARHPRVRLGTSVIVVPQRNAIVLAKELATLDSLSGGRVTPGVGIGWNAGEFANLGVADRFHVRGAYLDETIRLWRHLWSGSTEPFVGRFHPIDGLRVRAAPGQAAACRSSSAGRAEPRSAPGRERWPMAITRARRARRTYASGSRSIRPRRTAAGRPMPSLSARVRVEFGEDRAGERLRDARLSLTRSRPRSRRGPGSASTHLALCVRDDRRRRSGRAGRAVRS